MNQDLMDALTVIGEKDITILRMQRQIAYLHQQIEELKSQAETEEPKEENSTK